MPSVQGSLHQFANNSFLQQALEKSMFASGEGIAITFVYKGENYSASIHNFSPHESVQIGCVSKSLTATLIAIAQSEGRLQLEDSLTNYLPCFEKFPNLEKHLFATKIYHLLNHSNGFDHSLLKAVPKYDAGMIDSQAILSSLDSAGIISPAGEVLNYNSIGPWLAAAILEQVYGAPYADILESNLFAPLGIKAITKRRGLNICPSIGQDLRLSAQDLIKIAKLHLYGDPDRPTLLYHLRALRSQFSFPVPGCLPAGERCYPGWFDFDGSFGQLGYGEDSAGVVRLLPEQGAAIVVTSSHQKLANATLATVFKNILKDFGQFSLPQLLDADKWANTNPNAYKGSFENGKYRLVIDTAANGSLRGKVYKKYNEEGELDEGTYIKRYFKAAADHLFLPTQPEQLVCPILAFSHPDQNERFQIVSTSNYVFSRVEESE